MGAVPREIHDLRTLVSVMPLNVCCISVLPEFGLVWKDISRTLRNNRLPITPASVADILCQYAARNMTGDEISHIVSRLRLKSVAAKPRKWYVIKLIGKMSEEPFNILMMSLTPRIIGILKGTRICNNKLPEVQTLKLGDLIYVSIQMNTNGKEGSVFYLATPPGQSVALVSSLHSVLLKPCILSLGYMRFEDCSLSGRNINSLLRIHNEHNNTVISELPEYNVVPQAVRSGIDYTGMDFNQTYAREMLGPDPPHLDKLDITAHKEFYDPEILDKKMSVRIQIKSDDIAKSLQSWAVKGAILPYSELFQVFHEVKSNQIQIDMDEN